MNTKNIAVLGAGWLGSPLALSLRNSGNQVRVSASSSTSCQELRKDFDYVFQIHLDSSSISNNIVAFLDDIDVLIIAIPPDRNSNSEDAQLTSLMNHLQETTIPIPQIIYTSSIGVYPSPNTTVNEETVIQNISHPCFLNEQLLLKEPKPRTTILRLAGLVGGKRHPGNFFKNKKKITNSTAPINLVHQTDCIAAIKKVIELSSWNTIYNVCSETHPTKEIFYTKALLDIGETPPIFEKAELPSFKIVSTNKIKAVLDFEYTHSDLMHLLESNKWY